MNKRYSKEENEIVIEQVRSTVRYWFRTASELNRTAGNAWYHRTHQQVHMFAITQGISLEQACAVVSVLSPGVRWEQNIRDAGRVCSAWNRGKLWAKVGTYGRQVRKAFYILDECKGMDAMAIADYIGTENARKTRAFYWNLVSPVSSQQVTIDRWILRGMGFMVNRTTKRMYGLVSTAFRREALEIGSQPHQLQAIVWLEVKNRGVSASTYWLPGF